jgi:hypothetical protein
MSGAFYSSAEFRAPWGFVLPPLEHCLTFHIVTAGRCWLVVGASILVSYSRENWLSFRTARASFDK